MQEQMSNCKFACMLMGKTKITEYIDVLLKTFLPYPHYMVCQNEQRRCKIIRKHYIAKRRG